MPMKSSIICDAFYRSFISDRIGVMLCGRPVEVADTEALFKNPLHPYTRPLLSAIHIPGPRRQHGKEPRGQVP